MGNEGTFIIFGLILAVFGAWLFGAVIDIYDKLISRSVIKLAREKIPFLVFLLISLGLFVLGALMAVLNVLEVIKPIN